MKRHEDRDETVMKTVTSSGLSLSIWTVGLALLIGCSQPGPEDRLADIGADVDDMEQRLSVLTAQIEQQRDALHDLEVERRKAKSKLMTLEERLQLRATDVAIFRATQVNLLNEPALRNDAISVSVEDGVVTLSGRVSTLALKEKARNIAEAVPGVESTVVRIQVDNTAPTDPTS